MHRLILCEKYIQTERKKPYKFLPCQLKKNTHIVYLFYICVEFLLLRNFQLKHRFKNEKSQRNLDTLKETVRQVYKVLRKTEKYMSIQYDYIHEILPKDIFFVTTRELEEMFPDNTPKEREYYIAQAKGAVCIMQIGDKLECGEPHDGRAPDYDDWALNADIVVYYPVLDIALELSSMGIRVDEVSLKEQLDKAGCPERAELPFQKAILEKKLPYTMGGGIGQSRICMFFLRKAHIGEVQCSLWPEEMEAKLKEAGIQLL